MQGCIPSTRQDRGQLFLAASYGAPPREAGVNHDSTHGKVQDANEPEDFVTQSKTQL